VYIDPQRILEYAQSLHRAPSAPALDPRYTQGNAFWQAAYSALEGLNELVADVPAKFDERRTALLQIAARDVRSALLDAGFDTEDLESSVPAFCSEIAQLAQAQAQAFPRNYPDIESRRSLYATKGKQWAQALLAAKRAATAEGVVGLLAADLGQIEEAASAIRVAQTFVSTLERDLTASESHLVADGNPDELLASIRHSLSNIIQHETAATNPAESGTRSETLVET
jgi:hypothetical protein